MLREKEYKAATDGPGGNAKKKELRNLFLQSSAGCKSPTYLKSIIKMTTTVTTSEKDEWVPMAIILTRYGGAEASNLIEKVVRGVPRTMASVEADAR